MTKEGAKVTYCIGSHEGQLVYITHYLCEIKPLKVKK